jgi:hypothetical protein
MSQFQKRGTQAPIHTSPVGVASVIHQHDHDPKNRLPVPQQQCPCRTKCE